jgi:DNA-binding NarL/FixJ family response regulator
MITVLVADDHPMVREGLRALIEQLPDLELVGEVATGLEAVKEAVAERPDVVIMDLAMPELDGFEATRQIARVAPDTAVLILTMTEDDRTLSRAMRAGAKGYLLKGATKEQIVRAVTAVAAGEVIFAPAVAGAVLAKLTTRDQRENPFPQLTPREHQVLDLLAGGLSNAGIAAELHLSSKTISNVTSSIFTKLQVSGRTEAVILARDEGLGHRRAERM